MTRKKATGAESRATAVSTDMDGLRVATDAPAAAATGAAETGIPEPTPAAALAAAVSRVLPVVLERRGSEIRDTKGAARRLALSAVALFAERGYDEVTISQIAEAAEVNKRTFFRYFPNKETVILDIWDQTNTALIQLIEEAPATNGPFAALTAASTAWVEEYEDLLIGLAVISEQSRTLAPITMLHSAEWEEHIADALKRRFPDLDPDVADVASIIAMGSMRLARKRMLESAEPYVVEIARVFKSVERSRNITRFD